MTPELRDWLKAERDRIVRARESHATARTECKGCGCDLDIYVEGCRTCSNRKFNRQRYAPRQKAA